MRILAIGDIHGMSSCLDSLLGAVQLTEQDHLIFLGDYVDRGPDSRGVLNRLIALKRQYRVTCLRGNHEIMMCQAHDGRDDPRMWLSLGGRAALDSYSPRPGLAGTFDHVPAEHWQFLEQGLADYLETDRHIFVHANLNGSRPLTEQHEVELFWTFLGKPISHVSGKRVICGHTSQKSGVPLDLGDTICIDTYAAGGGWLTCLDADSLHYWQADVLGRIREADLPPRE